MKKWHGLWVPDSEDKLGGTFPYQRSKFLAAIKAFGAGKHGSLALDIGAHVGLWTLQLLEVFDQVICFEPDKQKHECWHLNVNTPRATLLRVALGSKYDRVALSQKPGTSLKTHVNPGAKGTIPMHRLDDLGIAGVNFIKIDCEGFEVYVVYGAEQTIKRDKPVIIIEQKDGVASGRYNMPDTAAVALLGGWGYEVVEELNGDYIMRVPK